MGALRVLCITVHPQGEKPARNPPKSTFSDETRFGLFPGTVAGQNNNFNVFKQKIHIFRHFRGILGRFRPTGSKIWPVFGHFSAKIQEISQKNQKGEKWGNTRANYTYSATHPKRPYSPAGVPICTTIARLFSS